MSKKITMFKMLVYFIPIINIYKTNKLYSYLYDKYEKKPSMIIHDGVDLSSYKPENLERFDNLDRKEEIYEYQFGSKYNKTSIQCYS